MDYPTITVDLSHDRAVARVKEAFKAQGFGTLKHAGSVVVETLDAGAIAAVPDIAELEPIAAEASRRIQAVLDDLQASRPSSLPPERRRYGPDDVMTRVCIRSGPLSHLRG